MLLPKGPGMRPGNETGVSYIYRWTGISNQGPRMRLTWNAMSYQWPGNEPNVEPE